MTILIVVGAIVALILITFWVIYNSLISAKNVVDEAFSGIDVQLKKRFELIPNLIEAVKGYNAHEAQVLQDIVNSRSGYGTDVQEASKADRSITGALRNFRIQVENYPDLQANTQFLKLMDNLSTVENELAMARRYYNGATRDHNTKIQKFPGVIVAGMMKLTDVPFYEIENDSERNAPKVELTNEE